MQERAEYEEIREIDFNHDRNHGEIQSGKIKLVFWTERTERLLSNSSNPNDTLKQMVLSRYEDRQIHCQTQLDRDPHFKEIESVMSQKCWDVSEKDYTLSPAG